MSVPENTSKRQPAVHLLGAMADGTSNYITDMEAAGQRQLVASTVLPIDARGKDAEFEALGFTFGDPTDDLFREATLPEGWTRKGTDHSMWSDVLDDRGVRRVAIFYKAAFYDRSAHMNLVNVGGDLAFRHIYGGGIDTTPWDVLTEEERADVLAAARDYLGRAAEYPDIYGDRAPRAQALLDRGAK